MQDLTDDLRKPNGLSVTIRDELDAFERLERALLADDRRERAARLNARFGLQGLQPAVSPSPPLAPSLPE